MLLSSLSGLDNLALLRSKQLSARGQSRRVFMCVWWISYIFIHINVMQANVSAATNIFGNDFCITGQGGSCDRSPGQQSEAAGRQIKYWIFGTMERLLRSRGKQQQWLPGCHRPSGHLGLRRSAIMRPHWGPRHLSHHRLCVGGEFGLQLN